ncbi:uncharacterized protein LOC113334167 [Papaver somniferum]|uniref:uncharacterized protein LOC113334167 n=1 Tax=Papaver somniferum TaxID=3469 RepID=UPI000E7005F5|nr:uncharacterized protein LOC113334167 [Papaver somniferum]
MFCFLKEEESGVATSVICLMKIWLLLERVETDFNKVINPQWLVFGAPVLLACNDTPCPNNGSNISRILNFAAPILSVTSFKPVLEISSYNFLLRVRQDARSGFSSGKRLRCRFSSTSLCNGGS